MKKAALAALKMFIEDGRPNSIFIFETFSSIPHFSNQEVMPKTIGTIVNVFSIFENRQFSQHRPQEAMPKKCYHVNVFSFLEHRQFSQHRPQEVMPKKWYHVNVLFPIENG